MGLFRYYCRLVLAVRFTQSYRELKDLWDAEARKKVHNGRHPLVFGSMLTIYTIKAI